MSLKHGYDGIASRGLRDGLEWPDDTCVLCQLVVWGVLQGSLLPAVPGTTIVQGSSYGYNTWTVPVLLAPVYIAHVVV